MGDDFSDFTLDYESPFASFSSRYLFSLFRHNSQIRHCGRDLQ